MRRCGVVGEIARLAMKRGLINCNGKTPDATMASALYTDLKRRDVNSIFVRPHEGLFGLREWTTEENGHFEVGALPSTITPMHFLKSRGTNGGEMLIRICCSPGNNLPTILLQKAVCTTLLVQTRQSRRLCASQQNITFEGPVAVASAGPNRQRTPVRDGPNRHTVHWSTRHGKLPAGL